MNRQSVEVTINPLGCAVFLFFVVLLAVALGGSR